MLHKAKTTPLSAFLFYIICYMKVSENYNKEQGNEWLKTNVCFYNLCFPNHDTFKDCLMFEQNDLTGQWMSREISWGLIYLALYTAVNLSCLQSSKTFDHFPETKHSKSVPLVNFMWGK